MTSLSDGVLAHLREAASWPALPDRYAALRAVGRGGSATVYAARDEQLERDVAIKVLDVADRSGSARARLAHEARILARLDHPGIVPIHEHGVLADGRPFYVMKLVDGRPFDVALHALPTLPDRLALFEKVLETVAFAHTQGLVHRDLKPSNVLVGPYGAVFVMDWGAAWSEAIPDERLVAGTPGFMPPEQERAGPVDRRADVFALGAILRGLLDQDRSPALVAVADRASAERPDDRYGSVEELAEELRRFRRGDAPAAYREPLAARLLRWYRRYELPVLLVMAYVLVRAFLLVWRGV